MIIALPVFQTEISSVFDFACDFLIIHVDHNKEVHRQNFHCQEEDQNAKIQLLIEHKVQLLICGAVSNFIYNRLAGYNIKVIPNISGDINSVLNAFINNRLNEPSFRLPGCKMGKGFKHRYGHGGRRKDFKNQNP